MDAALAWLSSSRNGGNNLLAQHERIGQKANFANYLVNQQ